MKEKRKKQKISVPIEFYGSLTKKPKPAHTCYLGSLYPYPSFFYFLSFKGNSIPKNKDIQEAKKV